MVTALERARAAAETVTDPELPMLTLRDLGVLRAVRVEGGRGEGDRVVAEISPTYSGCPALTEIRADLDAALRRAGFAEVELRTVLSPPWTSDDITPHGRRVLAEHGIAPPVARSTRVGLTLLPRRPVPGCPQCGSDDTELISAFGATACKQLLRCRSCREPFEGIRAS